MAIYNDSNSSPLILPVTTKGLSVLPTVYPCGIVYRQKALLVQFYLYITTTEVMRGGRGANWARTESVRRLVIDECWAALSSNQLAYFTPVLVGSTASQSSLPIVFHTYDPAIFLPSHS